MDQSKSLIQRLQSYSESKDYPMHMPGHKRRGTLGVSLKDIYTVDITEIPGFDDLHHPEGILRESLDMTRLYYGSYESFYSVNGSTACILAALGAAAGKGGRVIVASNRHWSVDNGAEIFDLDMTLLNPEQLDELGICGGIKAESLEQIFVESSCGDRKEIKAVLVVSPTYEGVVSDIEALAEVSHRYGALLIVDEAHGAHFHYSDAFPVPAGRLGADIVIESVHKTLPSMTQTALLHLMKHDDEIKVRLKHYLDIFISSSPSYVLMASIDQCVRYMNSEQARGHISQYISELKEMRVALKQMKCLRLLDLDFCEHAGISGVHDVDISRISVSCRGYLSGYDLAEQLRETYQIVIEKATEDYVIAISSVFDTREGMERLKRALMEIDHDLLSDGQVCQW